MPLQKRHRADWDQFRTGGNVSIILIRQASYPERWPCEGYLVTDFAL